MTRALLSRAKRALGGHTLVPRSLYEGFRFFVVELSCSPRSYWWVWVAFLVVTLFLNYHRSQFKYLIPVVLVLWVLDRFKGYLSPLSKPRFSTSPNAKVLKEINESRPCDGDKKRGYRREALKPKSVVAGSVHLSKEFNVRRMADPKRDVDIEILVGANSPYEKIISGIRRDSDAFSQIGMRRIREKLFDGLPLINERKIGIASDFDVNMDKLRVFETCYFATWCSGELAVENINWENKFTKSVYSDSRKRIPFKEYKKKLVLKPLSESSRDISTQFGINVIGVTEDYYLRVAIQGTRNMVGANQRVPLATGSMDWSDLTALGDDEQTLRNLGEHAANRELREEWGGNGERVNDKGEQLKITSFLPVGIFRLPARAGKPEFAALGRLNWWQDELIADRLEVEPWNDRTLPQGEDDRGLSFHVPDLDSFKKAIDKLLNNDWDDVNTTSLFGVLLCIEDLLKDRPDLICQTLGYQVPGSGLTITCRKSGHPPRSAAP